MKKYKVRVSERFEFLQIKIFQYIYEYSPNNAFVVFKAIADVVSSLEYMPEKYQVAREVSIHEELAGFNLRQAIVKNHRIIFLIQGDIVYVLAVLNCRQNALSPEDII
jgi:hypothetical protein